MVGLVLKCLLPEQFRYLEKIDTFCPFVYFLHSSFCMYVNVATGVMCVRVCSCVRVYVCICESGGICLVFRHGC